MATALRCDQATDLAAGYVLGALDAEESAAVREHLATCDQPHPEFAELGGIVPYLADTIDPVEPPAALRERIQAAAAADLRARARDDRAADRLISVLGRSPEQLVGSAPTVAAPPEGTPVAEPPAAALRPVAVTSIEAARTRERRGRPRRPEPARRRRSPRKRQPLPPGPLRALRSKPPERFRAAACSARCGRPTGP